MMEKHIQLFFPGINETVLIKLDDSLSPNTVKAILENLPIEVNINKWGKELYTDKTSITAHEENAKSEVNLLDVAYWPEGNALCLFYGPTPISKSDKIEPYSPVNIVGHIVNDQSNNIINKVKDTSRVIIKQA
ncbi:MAG TPA: cyclophilin-like fold protein [Nitrososphaeraceae archaeon]|jgi:uncharacterized protein|nr:cyclophilin-like fold protein [Nitrososphaeraceae archaeon]